MPICPRMFATTSRGDSARAESTNRGVFSGLSYHAFQRYAARRRKAGGCAGQHGSREYRRDPESLRQNWSEWTLLVSLSSFRSPPRLRTDVKAHTNSPIPALSLPRELFCHLFQEDRVSFVEVLG